LTNIVPGAAWSPIDVGARPARRKGRGAIAHVAVSESTKLIPGPLSSRGADWTFYLPKQPIDGQHRFWQMIDFDLQCWSSASGNATCPAWESQGGVSDANHEPWTDNQIEAGAIIYAYGMETEGWPAQLMPNSLAASRGLGYHRLGIDPWRVAGGEVWSSSRGKICPGDVKIAQLPTILARAVELFHGSPSPAPTPSPASSFTPSTVLTPPPRLAWNLPAGHYYGNIAGPARSHGGYYASERAFVRNIQQWLIWHQCVTGELREDWATSGWADSKWEKYTDWAMGTWHLRFYPNQPEPYQCWSDDYDRLARP
jgi:hypothetical protein